MPKRSMTRFLNLWEQIDCLLLVFPSSHLLAKMAKIKVLMQPFQFSMFQKKQPNKKHPLIIVVFKIPRASNFCMKLFKVHDVSLLSLPSLPPSLNIKENNKKTPVDLQIAEAKWCPNDVQMPLGCPHWSLLRFAPCGWPLWVRPPSDAVSHPRRPIAPATSPHARHCLGAVFNHQPTVTGKSIQKYLEKRCAIHCNPISPYLRSDKYNSKI